MTTLPPDARQIDRPPVLHRQDRDHHGSAARRRSPAAAPSRWHPRAAAEGSRAARSRQKAPQGAGKSRKPGSMDPSPDPRIPAPEACVLRHVLDRQPRERPSAVYVRFGDGSEWSYAELRRQVRRTAAALQALGVAQDDRVVVWMPNGPEALRVFMALGYIGAVYVPINTAYRGPLLAHVLANAGAQVLVADGRLLPRLGQVAVATLETAIVAGAAAAASSARRAKAAWDPPPEGFTTSTEPMPRRYRIIPGSKLSTVRPWASRSRPEAAPAKASSPSSETTAARQASILAFISRAAS